MLNYIKTISIISFCLLISCQTNDSIEQNETVLQEFSQEEAQDLQEIYDFFTNEICEMVTKGASNDQECFDRFTEDMKSTGSTGTYTHLIATNKIEVLFKRLKSGIFDEIWNRYSFTDEFGEIQQKIDLNIFKKYANFLFEVGKEYESIANYHEDIQRAGGIGVGAIASMILQPENYDTKDPRIRLMIAVHYITLSYQPENH